jgi:hypothetical protein
MRAGRHEFAGGAHAARWPFAVHEVRMTPLIAPEFQASFQRILTTTRLYFHMEAGAWRESRKRGSPGR